MKILKTIILIILATLLTLFTAYIILDVSVLWKLNFLNKFSLLQIYILIALVNLMRYKKSEIEDLDELVSKGYSALPSNIIYLFIFWGSAYLLHYFN